MTDVRRTRRSAKFRIGKEHVIVIILLIIPLCITIFLMFPSYREFTSRGQLVPVSDLGIDSSVYFTYVESGMTHNLYEYIAVQFSFRDKQLSFTAIEQEEVPINEEGLYESESLVDTVEYAVEAASSIVEEPAPAEDRLILTEEIVTKLEGYSGSSLGLMVGIGLYEEEQGIQFADALQLKIAGTGSLEEGGRVQTIGSLEQKLLGAEDEGVDLYFVPADYEWMGEAGNEAEAERVKRHYDLRLNIVPVQSLDEAIAYLKSQISGGSKP